MSAGTCKVTMDQDRAINVQFRGKRTLTVSKAGTGQGTLKSTGGEIDCGATCAGAFDTATGLTFRSPTGICVGTCVWPVPAAGSGFVGWSGIGCSALPAPECGFSLTANATVTATFAKQHTLTVTKTGSGTGTVKASGLDCGLTCSAAYNEGTAVTLNATPAANTRFAGWSGGGCSGTGACTVTLNQAANITASFNAQARLTVTNVGLGTGTVTSVPPGIDCGTTCSAFFDVGAAVTLTAVANAGSLLFGYVDNVRFLCGEGVGNRTSVCTNTLEIQGGTYTRQVDFTVPRTFTVTTAGAGSGRVVSTPAGVDCGTVCSYPFPAGEAVYLTAVPDQGSKLSGWSDNCRIDGSLCHLSTSRNQSAVATFELIATPTPTPTPTPTATATATATATPEPTASPSSTPPLGSAPPAASPTPVATPRTVDTRLVKAKIRRPGRTATFTFTGVGATRFECALAKKGKKAKFKACKSPVAYKKLTRGSYTFQVRAVGDATPARRSFRI
jgi:hypothetical protein